MDLIFFIAAAPSPGLGNETFALTSASRLGALLFGLLCIVIGIRRSVTGKFFGPSRRGGYQVRTADTAWGGLVVFWGLLTLQISLFAGRDVIVDFVHHPGPVFLAIGISFLLLAVIAFSGSGTDPKEPRWSRLLSLITARLLPGLILAFAALTAIAIGLFELISPERFDSLGGGLLELLFLPP